MLGGSLVTTRPAKTKQKKGKSKSTKDKPLATSSHKTKTKTKSKPVNTTTSQTPQASHNPKTKTKHIKKSTTSKPTAAITTRHTKQQQHKPTVAKHISMYAFDSMQGRTEFYMLKQGLMEKEPSVDEQKASTILKFEGHQLDKCAALLTEGAERNARFFTGFVKGTAEPGRPNESGRKGYYIKSPDTLAFRGVGGKDMAIIWHMLMIPNHSLFDKKGENVVLRWIYDLKPEHATLLRVMRTLALAWVARNKVWFIKRYERRLGKEGVKHWLQPENIQIGFHKKPSVGVLHMHVLVGPLTDFGSEPEMLERWVPLKDVLAVVSAGAPVTEENLRQYASDVATGECSVM